MGAWGIGAFENDAALDFVDELREGERTVDLSEYSGAYLETDQVAELVALLAILAAVKTEAWGDEFDVDDAEVLSAAVAAVDVGRLLQLSENASATADASELAELWAEVNQFDDWKATITGPAASLRAAG